MAKKLSDLTTTSTPTSTMLVPLYDSGGSGADKNLTTAINDFVKGLPEASTSAKGLLSASDKTKLNGLVLNSTVQAYDATLAALAGTTVSANQIIYATGADTFATASLTTFARTILDDADAGAVRTTLGLVPGTNVQVYDANLTGFLTTYDLPTSGGLVGQALTLGSGGTITWTTPAGGGDMLKTENLSGLASPDTALTNLGGTALGTAVFKAASTQAARDAISATGYAANLASLKGILVAQITANMTVMTPCRATAGDLGGGLWVFRTGDRSADVTADPGEGMVAAPTDASSGASGAWYRLTDSDVYRAAWWGCYFNGTDQCAELRRAMKWVGVNGGGTIMGRRGGTLTGTNVITGGTSFGGRAAIWFDHNNVTLDLTGVTVTLANGADCEIVKMGLRETISGQPAQFGVTNCHLVGGWLDGNRANQTTPTDSLHHYGNFTIETGSKNCTGRGQTSRNAIYYHFAIQRDDTENCGFEDFDLDTSGADGMDIKNDSSVGLPNFARRGRVTNFGLVSGLAIEQAGVDLRDGSIVEDVTVTVTSASAAAKGLIAIRTQQGADNAADDDFLPEHRTTVRGVRMIAETATGTTGLRNIAPYVHLSRCTATGFGTNFLLSGYVVDGEDLVAMNGNTGFRHATLGATDYPISHTMRGARAIGCDTYGVRIGPNADGVDYINPMLTITGVNTAKGVYVESGAQSVEFFGGRVTGFDEAVDDAGLAVRSTGTDGLEFRERRRLNSREIIEMNDEFIKTFTNWTLGHGSNGAAADPVLLTTSANGLVRGTMGTDAGGTVALNGSGMWDDKAIISAAPSLGISLASRARMQMSTGKGAFFVGLTSTSTLVMPLDFTSGSDTLGTLNATNCIGFLFNGLATTKQWWAVARNASGTPQALASGVTEAGFTFYDFLINIASNGDAEFFLNGARVAKFDAAVSTGVVFRKKMIGYSTDGTAGSWEADMFNLTQGRV